MTNDPLFDGKNETVLKDSHHIIQDARVNHAKDYSTSAAPSIRLDGPSSDKTTEHYAATQAQRIPNGGTYQDAWSAGERALRAAGVDELDIHDAMVRADIYFKGQLCLTDSSPVSGEYRRR